MDRRSTKISDLDLSSLQYILSYLRYVDKLKLLLATKCIAKLAEEIIDNEPFDLFNMQMNFSVEEIKQLLIDYGCYVKRLRYTESFRDETLMAYLELLPAHCTNLQEIFFSELEITTTNMYGQILSSSQKTLEKLSLEKCTVRKLSCSLVANLSQLKVLNLQCSSICGEGFGKLKNLTDLNLRECKKFQHRHFMNILRSNKLVKLSLGKLLPINVLDMLLETQTNLTVLNIGNSLLGINPELCGMKTLREISISGYYQRSVVLYLEGLVKNRVPIESVEINATLNASSMPETIKSEVVDQIIQLDMLRVLSFRNNVFLENGHLVKVAKFCRNIEMLDLFGTCFSDLGIIGCLEYLKGLRHLDVSYCNVKESLYRRLVEIRQELGFTRKLVVYIRPQMELRTILQSDEYADTMAFVQLTHRLMRSASDRSILERLEQLDLTYFSYTSNSSRPVSRLLRPLSSTEPTLLALDDNSLYHIMQYLPLVDQLALTLSNSRFENIIKYFLYSKSFNVVELVANFTIREAKNLLPRCGRMVKKLHIERPIHHFDAEYYDLVAEYFTNVVELHSDDVELCREVITNSRHSLEAIHLKSCEINEDVTLDLSKAAKLHTLALARSNLTGVHLGNLTSLTTLNLSNVKDLEPEPFIAICKSNRLKDLNIEGCEKLNNPSFQVLVETQINLDTLAVGEVYAATNTYLVARLENLKDLKYHCPPEELLQCMDLLAELKCDQMRFLDVPCRYEISRFSENVAALTNLLYLRISQSSAINSGFIKALAKGCPLLKVLDVSAADNLNDGGIFEAIRLFKHLRHFDVNYCDISSLNALYRGALEIKRNGDSRGTLVLYARTSIQCISDIVNTRDYINNMKYVELSREFLLQLNKHELVNEDTQYKDKTLLTQSNIKHVRTFKSHILNLPGSCLQRIASYLQPVDKLVFAYLHETIAISIEAGLDNLLFSLNDMARIFTISEAQDLFAVCAGHIKRIQISTNDRTGLIDYINLLQPYRSYLTEIDLTWNGEILGDEVMPLFGTGDQKLQKLTLNEFQSIDTILEHLTRNQSELKVLNILGSYLTGQYIDAFKRITDLSLMNSSSIKNEYFQSICHNCKLKRLNIIGVRFLDESCFKVLVDTQNSHLEQLFMSCRYETSNYTEVAKLESLRQITIEINVPLPQFKTFLKMIVRYRRGDLEYLEVETRSSKYVFEICLFDMIEEVKSSFRNLKDIVIKQDRSHCYFKDYF